MSSTVFARVPMLPEDVPRAKEGVLFRELEDGCVLYDPQREMVHSLNMTAGAIWCLINGSRSVAEIADEISFMTKAGREKVQGDVFQMIHKFVRQGLVEC